MRKSITNDQWVVYENAHIVDKIPLVEICEKHKINYRTLYYGLKRRGIPITLYKVDKRRYDVEDTYFDVIDTESKAYILGLLASDGYVISEKDTVFLKLSTQDEETVKFVRDSISPKKPLYYERAGTPRILGKVSRSAGACKVEIRSSKLVKSLEVLGITDRKTGNEIYPTIPDNMHQHFIRGFFDGDGSVSYTVGKPLKTLNLYICCTNHAFLVEVQKKVGGAIYTEVRGKYKTMYRLMFTNKKSAFGFMQFMYKNSTVRMSRKFEKCALYANTVLSQKSTGQRNA